MGNGIIDFAEDAIGAVEQITRLANRRLPRSRPQMRSAPTQDARPRVHRSERPVARRGEFSIIDAIDADTGHPVFIVKNQQGDSAACSSMTFAQRVKDSLG